MAEVKGFELVRSSGSHNVSGTLLAKLSLSPTMGAGDCASAVAKDMARSWRQPGRVHGITQRNLTFPHSFSFPCSQALCAASAFLQPVTILLLVGEVDSVLAEHKINQDPDAGKPMFRTGQPGVHRSPDRSPAGASRMRRLRCTCTMPWSSSTCTSGRNYTCALIAFHSAGLFE